MSAPMRSARDPGGGCGSLSGDLPVGKITISEKQWLAQVVHLARLLGYLVYHTHDSRHSAAGFPDLTLVHPARGVIFAELKTARGKVSPWQGEWIMALRAAGARVYIWRPDDFEQVRAVLAGEH